LILWFGFGCGFLVFWMLWFNFDFGFKNPKPHHNGRNALFFKKKIKKHVLNDGKDFKDGNDNVL
jgi:hypothetical protein